MNKLQKVTESGFDKFIANQPHLNIDTCYIASPPVRLFQDDNGIIVAKQVLHYDSRIDYFILE